MICAIPVYFSLKSTKQAVNSGKIKENQELETNLYAS